MAQWMPTRPTMGARSFGAFPGGLAAGDWQRAPYGDTRGYAGAPGLGGGYQFTPTRPYAGSASRGLERLAQLYQRAGFGGGAMPRYPGGGYQGGTPPGYQFVAPAAGCESGGAYPAAGYQFTRPPFSGGGGAMLRAPGGGYQSTPPGYGGGT